MKNTSKLALESIITLGVAALLSTILALILAFISGNLNLGDGALVYINTVSGIAFGLMVGYRLNTLVRKHK